MILSLKIGHFDQVMVNLGLLSIIFCKVKYSNEIYRPNNLKQQTKCQGHWALGSIKYFKRITIYWHGSHCKVGLDQPRIIICEYLVEPTFPMLHTMSQIHWHFDYRDDSTGFYHLRAWLPSWSCDHKQMEILIWCTPGRIFSQFI